MKHDMMRTRLKYRLRNMIALARKQKMTIHIQISYIQEFLYLEKQTISNSTKK